MNVRDKAVNCTAKLYAFRKTREGVVVQFVLHPNEVPAKLQTDPIGTSYMMALVEVDDATGQPKGGTTETQFAEDKPRQSPPNSAAGARNRFAMESAILCKDVRFQAFLQNRDPEVFYRMAGKTLEEAAANYVRRHCGVTSRADIVNHSGAIQAWDRLAAAYYAEPEVTG